MDFDWDEEPSNGVYVYIAMSDDLQEWAFHNDRLHLLKIGYSDNPESRLAYLNGKRRRGSKWVRPCLNFTDWRIAGKWWLPHYGPARQTERRLKTVFARAFGQFDRTEIVKGYPANNGETEIYRLPLRNLPVLPEFFRRQGSESRAVNQAVTITEKAVEEIQRQWQRRLCLLEPQADDSEARPTVSIIEDRYGHIVEQMWEDMLAEDRDRDDGWPYRDD